MHAGATIELLRHKEPAQVCLLAPETSLLTRAESLLLLGLLGAAERLLLSLHRLLGLAEHLLLQGLAVLLAILLSLLTEARLLRDLRTSGRGNVVSAKMIDECVSAYLLRGNLTGTILLRLTKPGDRLLLAEASRLLHRQLSFVMTAEFLQKMGHIGIRGQLLCSDGGALTISRLGRSENEQAALTEMRKDTHSINFVVISK